MKTIMQAEVQYTRIVYRARKICNKQYSMDWLKDAMILPTRISARVARAYQALVKIRAHYGYRRKNGVLVKL